MRLKKDFEAMKNETVNYEFAHVSKNNPLENLLGKIPENFDICF